ncbi:MAG: DUF4382 domain-containing protein [Bacteroidota bacterium]
MKNLRLAGLLVMVAVILAGLGCTKDSSGSSEQGTMDVRMTDDVGFYDKVYIDVQGIKVNIEGRGWVDVTPTRTGIYNILELNNGIDTLIASSSVPVGNVTEVRLILGPNNTVVVNGTTWPMDAPSAEESGLKIKINQAVTAGAKCTIWLDFNVHKSIVVKGNGGFSLKPVIRCFIHSFTGAIIGDVNPDNVAYFAYAVPVNNVNDTFMTFLRSDGTFKLWGLLPRTYNVGLMTKEKADVKTINNVSVSAGQETNLGQISIP